MAGIAIQDAVTVLHGGAGCDIKLHSLLHQHNLTGDVHSNVVCTKVSDHELILDPGDVLINLIKDIAERTRAKLAILTAASFVEVSGIDWDHILTIVRQQIDIPVIYVQAPDYTGDLFKGYFLAVERIAEYFARNQDEKNRSEKKVNVIGYIFDRPEYEHFANLHEIRRYLKALGLSWNVILFEGAPAERLEHLLDARYNIVFPGGQNTAKHLKNNHNQIPIHTFLPIGMRFTKEYLERIAEVTGTIKAAKAFIAKEEHRLHKMIRTVNDSIIGKRVAVFSDSYKINGLLDFCRDVKLTPVVAGVLNETPEEFTISDADDIHVMERMGHNTVNELLINAAKNGDIDMVIGTSNEANIAKKLNIPSIEFGFPCNNYHVLYPMPYLGYCGEAVLLTRVLEIIERK